MNAAIFAEAIASAEDARLDELARGISHLWGSGDLTDDEAGSLYEAIATRRKRGGAIRPAAPIAARVKRGTIFPPKRRQRSPDREASVRRRRELACVGALPPALAASFTEGERAVLSVVVAEVRAHGGCDRSIDELAARAGVSRSTTKNALRAAKRLGLVSILERPIRGRKNMTNVVAIVSAEWVAWIDRGTRRAIGVKAHAPTNKKKISSPLKGAAVAVRRPFRPFRPGVSAQKKGAGEAPSGRSGETA